MKSLLKLLVVLTVLFPLGLNAQPGAVTLPPVSGYNLQKNKVTLPQDLPAANTLLVFSFLHNQQPDVDGWVSAANSIGGLHPWSLPVFPHENFAYRWWVNSSLRSASQDARQWDTTLPLYVNKHEFLDALQIKSEREVTVLLVNRSGAILWRTSGVLTQEKRRALAAAVAAKY